MTAKPIIAVTLGDPAGIGPEITAKVFVNHELYHNCRPLVVGDAAVLQQAVNLTGLQNTLTVRSIHDVKDAAFQPGSIDVYDLGLINPHEFALGEVSDKAGNAAFHYVKQVVELALAGDVDATVTNAIHKEAINLAGHHYSGHTEIYAALTGAEKYTMLLVHEDLRVVHVSTHVSLRQACELVKKERVLEVIEIAYRACKSLGIASPKIGVAGLNPHSGENGLFGREELDEIIPAIRAANEMGIDAEGPVPPDTVFPKARGGWYDIVVAMYHDQGHIPLKTVGFVYNREEKKWDDVAGVNITLGLPVIRTSVDHGTAFDQAGKGTASPKSLQNAIDYAMQMAKNKPL